jgi:hypothetical protein
MVDILGEIGTGLALYKSLFDLRQVNKKNRKELYTDLFEPLFKKMKEVSVKYHKMIVEVRDALRADNPDFQAIANKLSARRNKLVMDRNAVLGEADAFISREFKRDTVVVTPDPRCGSIRILPEDFDIRKALLSRKGQLALLMYNFGSAIKSYFHATPNFQYGNTYASGTFEILTMLADATKTGRRARDPSEISNLGGGGVDYILSREIEGLEKRWVDVTKAFTELKLFCQL